MAEPERRRQAIGPQWAPGTAVAVRNRFIDGWAEGFVVESTEPQSGEPRSGEPRSAGPQGAAQYRLRRLSDNAVLPAFFPAEDLRAT